MGVIENIKKKGFKDILNPKKWGFFIKSKSQDKNGIHLEKSEILSYSEQLVYRAIVCGECFKRGACVSCECPQPDAAILKEHECDLKKYRPMMEKDRWENFKKLNNIKFTIG